MPMPNIPQENDGLDDLDTALLDSMDSGIEDVTPAAPEPDAVVEEEQEEVTEPEQSESEPEGEPEPEPAEEDAQAAAAKAVDDEIASLGLKEKAGNRFRELTTQVSELAPLRDALEKAGIKDISELPRYVERAKVGDDMVAMVTETGADAEQYGAVLDHLANANRAFKHGDMEAAQRGYDMAMNEATAFAKLLGKEIPGMVNPIEAHADLVEMLENGDITKQAALEIAASRTQGGVRTKIAEQAAQQNQVQQAQEQGANSLRQLDAQWSASDPDYPAKRPALNQMCAFIRKTLPPEQWAAATQQAYATIPAPPRAPAPRQPVPGPVRGQGPRPNMAPEFETAEEALEWGIRHAS